MIKISIKKEENNIFEVQISGHANYEEAGKDIVCASVSSIVATSVNAIIRINEESINYEEKDGFVKIEVKKQDPITNKLLENMIELLNELANDYKNYIKFK